MLDFLRKPKVYSLTLHLDTWIRRVSCFILFFFIEFMEKDYDSSMIFKAGFGIDINRGGSDTNDKGCTGEAHTHPPLKPGDIR